MKIYINDRPFVVDPYDDGDMILQRYSLKEKNSLPEYFQIAEDDFHLDKNTRLSVKDIREEIRGISIEELTKGRTLGNFLSKYPKLEKTDLILLILRQNPDIDTDKAIYTVATDELHLRKLDHITFYDARESIRKAQKYPEIIRQRRKELKNKLGQQEEIMKQLNSIKEVEMKPFSTEGVTILISFDLPLGFALPDVFDAMNVSKYIPFIHLVYQGKEWYKTYQHIIPPKKWIKRDVLDDGLYFKILSSSYSKLTSRRKIETLYSKGIWNTKNEVEISFDIQSDYGETQIKERFLNSLGDRLVYKIVQEKQLSIKGQFSVEDFTFNKAVFADMISNSEIFSHFLFLNERQGNFSGYRSAITKARFNFYYQPRQTGSLTDSLTITVTPRVSDSEGKAWIDVRISRAMNEQQIKSFRNIFSKLLAIYLQQEESVIKLYGKLLPSSKKLFNLYVKTPKKSKTKIDKKTGKRLKQLKTLRPEVFRSGYASMCQPKSHQPYIVDKKEAKAISKKYGEHKIMEFTDAISKETNWYACEPREQGEPRTHIYPGLRENKHKTNAKYREEVPYLPCCFTEDQYTKPAAELHKRVEAQRGIGRAEKDINVGDIGHVFKPNKTVSEGRFGQIPFYLSFIVQKAGYKEIKRGKQVALPIFRYGVVHSPDSFIHCLEKAFVPRYSSLPINRKIEKVKGIRKEMAEMNLAVAKQELYDYSDEAIREILLEDETYLDPGLWIRLAEIKYNCNIFIYQISDDFPNGAVVIPRFSQAYLPRDISENLPSVFIIKKNVNKDYPFQCELLVKFNPTGSRAKRFVYSFQNEPLVNEAIRVFYESNKISVVTSDRVFYYPPAPIIHSSLFKNAASQYIDDTGKTRMITFTSGVSLMTSPLPPLNIPVDRKITRVTRRKAKDFIKKKGMVIMMQDGDSVDMKIQGVWVKSNISINSGIYYGYIPIEIANAFDDVEFTPPTLNDPLRGDATSDLEMMYKTRKIADYLKQYILFEYSRDPENFDPDDLIVRPDHIYNISKLEKRLIPDNDVMYKNSRLIVPSEKVANHLISFLQVQLLNNQNEILSYKDRYVIKDHYRTLTDFRKASEQLIFLTTESLERWMCEKSRGNENVVRSHLLSTDNQQPYFYRNSKIGQGKLTLIQNVKDGELSRALAVSSKWAKDKVNLGFNTPPSSEELTYAIYTEDGVEKIVGKISDRVSHYILNRDGNYASILFV